MPLHTVVETPGYLADARRARLKEYERNHIIDTLAADPTMGDLIPGTGGARKIRFGGRGKGKSGGYRVITLYGGSDMPVFLLNVFAKGDKVNLTQAERNELQQILGEMLKAYKKRR